MGVAFTLRDNGNVSYFKEVMLGMLNKFNSDEAFLGTGYISEYDTYKISDEKNKYNKNIISSLPRNYKFITMGVMNNSATDDNYLSYIKFVNKINSNRPDVKVKPFYEKSGCWHAKVFILLKNSKPIAGIIGSSNLTKKAYGSPVDKFNFEADMIIWDESCNSAMQLIIKALPEKSGFFMADFIPSFEEDSEMSRVENIYNKIRDVIDNAPGEPNNDGLYEVEL